MLTFIYPVLYMKYSQQEVVFVSGVIAAVAVIIESTRFYSPKIKGMTEKVFSAIGKAEEVYRISGITYMALGALFTVVFFRRVIAVPVLICAILGDAVSSLVANKWGGSFRIFRNKSLEGTLACFATCLVAGWLLLRTPLAAEGLDFNLVLAIALLTTLFDVIPIPMDDNISTPLGVGFFAQMLMR